MKTLLFVSALCLMSCRPTQHWGVPPNYTGCLENIRPRYGTSWYNTKVDVVGRHLSGLLLIKELAQSYRVVFTSETGLTMFDFEFTEKQCEVRYIIPQLNRKVIINALKKDFGLMLGSGMDGEVTTSYTKDEERLQVTKEKSTTVWIADRDCSRLSGIEFSSDNKRQLGIHFYEAANRIDSIALQHYNFAMDISLKRLER